MYMEEITLLQCKSIIFAGTTEGRQNTAYSLTVKASNRRAPMFHCSQLFHEASIQKLRADTSEVSFTQEEITLSLH